MFPEITTLFHSHYHSHRFLITSVHLIRHEKGTSLILPSFRFVVCQVDRSNAPLSNKASRDITRDIIRGLSNIFDEFYNVKNNRAITSRMLRIPSTAQLSRRDNSKFGKSWMDIFVFMEIEN